MFSCPFSPTTRATVRPNDVPNLLTKATCVPQSLGPRNQSPATLKRIARLLRVFAILPASFSNTRRYTQEQAQRERRGAMGRSTVPPLSFAFRLHSRRVGGRRRVCRVSSPLSRTWSKMYKTEYRAFVVWRLFPTDRLRQLPFMRTGGGSPLFSYFRADDYTESGCLAVLVCGATSVAIQETHPLTSCQAYEDSSQQVCVRNCTVRKDGRARSRLSTGVDLENYYKQENRMS